MDQTTWVLTPDDVWHVKTREWAPASLAFVECGEFARANEQERVLAFGILPDHAADETICDVCVAEIAVLA